MAGKGAKKQGPSDHTGAAVVAGTVGVAAVGAGAAAAVMNPDIASGVVGAVGSAGGEVIGAIGGAMPGIIEGAGAGIGAAVGFIGGLFK